MDTKANCSDMALPDACDYYIANSESSKMSSNAEHCLSTNDSDVNATASNEFADVKFAANQLSEMLAQHSQAECFILDIDLDFFSTLNPFLSSLTALQFQLLLELYAYTPPIDSYIQVSYYYFGYYFFGHILYATVICCYWHVSYRNNYIFKL